ncbi:MAG: adenylate/guanylate cyclase domain-containing protein [Spirochaetota bacterium]
MTDEERDSVELEMLESVPDDDDDVFGVEAAPEPEHRIDPQELREEIQNFYLPTQLVDAIMEMGGIPTTSEVMIVGVGFIDIADYTYLSQFLSPQENQDVLNGLYTAFAGVLKRHGGYLNKIEGDSLMFHYGGTIDPRVRDMPDDEVERYIAKELFYTCVEMQRVCSLFNQANEKFLLEGVSDEAKAALKKAFDIVSTLRNSFELSRSINALFQIRIRIGANIGPVTIGNFGPDGAKQWDVVGNAVIDAKRMESSAPVGGLRISKALYEKLVETRVAEEYYERFLRESLALGSYYRNITRDELFKYGEVLLADKRGATFETYSVQVTPNLPESIAEQVSNLISMGLSGADRVLDLLRYYRGNPYVINAIEDALRRAGVVIRKRYMLEILYPLQLQEVRQKLDDDMQRITAHVDAHFSLYEILDKLGRFQDIVKRESQNGGRQADFEGYEEYMHRREREIRAEYEQSRKQMVQRAYFFNVLFPLVFESIRSSILEYQNEVDELETLAGA